MISDEIRDAIGPENKNVGLFPVDEVACRITRSMLGSNAETILKRCGSTGGVKLLNKSGEVCALQYPLLNGTIDSYLDKTGITSPTEIKSIGVQLFNKLMKLHGKRCFHLDIKDGNIGYFLLNDFRFADWGLSKCFKNISKFNEVYNSFVSSTVSIQFMKYYVHFGGRKVQDMVFKLFPAIFNNVPYLFNLKYN